MIMIGCARGPRTSEQRIGTRESEQSLTRELEVPQSVAASTPSRVFETKLLRTPKGGAMELVISRCAGMDVHQATVVVTVRLSDEAGRRRSVTETFGTMTPDLLALRDWLQA
jgi:hypothetical protein